MLLAADFSLVLGGRLVQLEAPVLPVLADGALVRLPLLSAHWREASRDSEVLTQHSQGIYPRDGRAHGQAHRIPERVADLCGPLFDDTAVTAEPFHADCRNPLPLELREHARLKASKACVEAIQRQLAGVEWKIEREHAQVNLGILVTGEADIPRLALRFRPRERLDGPSLGEMTLRV